jgi:hypothetical protein
MAVHTPHHEDESWERVSRGSMGGEDIPFNGPTTHCSSARSLVCCILPSDAVYYALMRWLVVSYTLHTQLVRRYTPQYTGPKSKPLCSWPMPTSRPTRNSEIQRWVVRNVSLMALFTLNAQPSLCLVLLPYLAWSMRDRQDSREPNG